MKWLLVYVGSKKSVMMPQKMSTFIGSSFSWKLVVLKVVISYYDSNTMENCWEIH